MTAGVDVNLGPEAMSGDMLSAYMTGWGHGATDHQRDRKRFSHDRDLLKEYLRGHQNGFVAADVARRAASDRLGFKIPTPLPKMPDEE